jgi:hypothetical protein
MPKAYNILDLYPKGFKRDEDISDAVMSALRTLFQAGLDPAATKTALIKMKGLIEELLKEGNNGKTLDQ